MSAEDDAKNKAIDDEAAALVAAVAPAAVAALIARYPEAEHVGIRSNWNELDPHSARRVPVAPAARADYLAKLIDSNQAELQRDIARYNDLRVRGLAALSRCDILISSGGRPLEALRCALDRPYFLSPVDSGPARPGTGGCPGRAGPRRQAGAGTGRRRYVRLPARCSLRNHRRFTPVRVP